MIHELVYRCIDCGGVRFITKLDDSDANEALRLDAIRAKEDRLGFDETFLGSLCKLCKRAEREAEHEGDY